MTDQPDTYEVRVIRLSRDSDTAAVTICHSKDGLLRDHAAVVGPRFSDFSKAQFVAAHLTWALRQQGVPIAPALTIKDAAALITAIETEIELTMDAWYDDKHFDWGTPLWVDTLRSVKLKSDGSVTLDPDQALAVVDVVVAQLETAEDFDEVAIEGQPELNEPTPERLRAYGWQLEKAGFPIDFGGAGRTDEGYRIRLAAEPVAHADQAVPYDVIHNGEVVGSANTLAEAWKLIEKHRNPGPMQLTKDKE